MVYQVQNQLIYKMYTDKNVNIFKYIKNLEEIDSSNTYDGIFAIKANNSKNFYNLYTIIDRQKHYLYLDVNDAEANKQFIKLTKIKMNLIIQISFYGNLINILTR